jgi:selenocysteine lyase/cysteine desulfurase
VRDTQSDLCICESLLGTCPPGAQERGFALRHGHLYAHRLVSRLAEVGRWDGGADDGVVRVSLLHYNTPAEVAALCAALEAVL